MILDALLNAAYHVSLHGPGATLEGDVHPPPRPVVFGAEHRPGARERGNVQLILQQSRVTDMLEYKDSLACYI